MSVNILSDEAQAPTDELVEACLGATWVYFEELRALTARCDQDFRHYGKKYGWKLKVHADHKTLFELTVADGWFLVSIATREIERQEFRSDPDARALVDVGAAETARDGYVIKIEIRDRASCERAKALARFIMARRSLI